MTLVWTSVLAFVVLAAVACSQQPDGATSSPGSGSRPGGIEGTVVDLQDRPVPGIRVAILSGTAAFPEISPETDEEGYFQIGGVPPGTFQVAAHDRDGREIGLKSVTVTSGETATVMLTVMLSGAGRQPSMQEPTSISTKEPTDGLCLPAAKLGVSVGDTWTLSGPVKVPVGFPGELPQNAAELASTFVVTAVETIESLTGRGSTPIQQPSVSLRVTNITLDTEGNVLTTEDSSGSWAPAAVANLGPVLTPDWECHKRAWLNGWPPAAKPSVGERSLLSGITAVVFSVSQPFVFPDQGIDATVVRHHGYEIATGRVVLQEIRATGTMNGKPLDMQILQELGPAGADDGASNTGPGTCDEYLEVVASIDQRRIEVQAVVTSYQCLSSYLDSTAQYPFKSPSLVVPHGVPLSLRLEPEAQPNALDVRLYPGAGVSVSELVGIQDVVGV